MNSEFFTPSLILPLKKGGGWVGVVLHGEVI